VPKDDVKDGEPTKTEAPPATNHVAEPSGTSVPEPKEDDKPAEGSPNQDRPKSPSFLIRFLEGLPRPGKSKGGKKKEKAPAPAAEEPPVPAEEPSPADAKPEDKPAVVEPVEGGSTPDDPAKDTTPAPAKPEDPVQEEQKNGEGKKEDAKPSRSPAKVARRLSARVNEFLTARRKHVDTPAKVDEDPPKIEEPTPVAPLENPAADSAPPKAEEPPKEDIKEANEPPKIIDSTPAPVAATA
jgi:hypothetical protein